MHVLIIDDEVGVVDNLKIYLNDQRHTCAVLRYVTSEHDLCVELEKKQPDGVILDFGMRVPGDRVYQWIKKCRKDNPPKIVFYTCWANDEKEKAKMKAVGASEREIIWKREVGSDVRKLLRILT